MRKRFTYRAERNKMDKKDNRVSGDEMAPAFVRGCRERSLDGWYLAITGAHLGAGYFLGGERP